MLVLEIFRPSLRDERRLAKIRALEFEVANPVSFRFAMEGMCVPFGLPGDGGKDDG